MPTAIEAIHYILFVQDQKQSTEFYRKVLALEPTLNVPGMTEFTLSNGTILGLMPISGVKKLFGERIDDTKFTKKVSRSELYLLVENPQQYHNRALKAGAEELSPFQERNWGHCAAYSLDPDGHILAFAEKINK